ncbi:hypothetical protein T479_16990 [Lysinibacillus varians]|uniref:hypothetical protein n=1 Tax=Lysinibacillus varians TaxID=1145276 RepID=UPI00042EDF9C|nr:hypothetical protein [Lysinibacillus varians]AHN24414.1 hypothetical protein T479_16990 [Lysinibacillus varians]
MIEIEYQISREVKQKVNKVIGEITTFFIQLCEDSDDFDVHMQYIFPSHLLREDFDKCKDIIYDINEYANDKHLHNLKPIYEYALYHLIQWYIDVTDDEDQIILDISSLNIKHEDDKYIIKNLNNLESYKEFLFSDWDFLDLEDFLNIYFKAPEAIKPFNINLHEYTDLMPKDIRLKFLQTVEKEDITLDIKDLIVRIIHTAIKQKENDPRRLKETTETQLSDDISYILQAALTTKGIITAREQPRGFALKNIGELDFFIYSNSNYTFRPIAIGENKEWSNFERQLKQLIGYMTEDIEFGFTILFNKSTKLETILNRRKNLLQNFYVELNGEKHFETIEMKEGYNEINDIVITKHKNPENNTNFEIYHFIVNAYRPEREEAAKQARKRK